MNNSAEPTKPGNDLSRRRFLQMTGLASGAAILAACAPAEAPAPAAPGDAAAPTAEGATISWWNQYSTSTTQIAIPQIIAGFEEMYPGVTVDYEITGGPPGGGDYTEVLLARIAAGNPPNAATTWDPPAQFAARGSLSALDDFMENAQYATHNAFFEGPLNSCRWQGRSTPVAGRAASTACRLPPVQAASSTTWESSRKQGCPPIAPVFPPPGPASRTWLPS